MGKAHHSKRVSSLDYDGVAGDKAFDESSSLAFLINSGK